MLNDPIVEEIRTYRRALTEPFGGDLHAICEDIRRRERGSDQEFVTYPSRPPASTVVDLSQSHSLGTPGASTVSER